VHELAQLPRSLIDFYSLVIDNNLKLEKHRRAIAKMALRWRLCTPNASTKMTIAACTACTKVSSPRATDVSASEILDVCSNLVVLDNETENFRFAHLSIRKSDFINNPLNLAFCFDWPEVLDHFEAVQDSSKVRGNMTDGMTWAIRHGQVLAVRWLLARAVRPLEWKLSLAFTLGRENLVRNFYESGMLSAIIVLNGDHVLMYAANYDFQDLFWYLINQGAIVDWRDQAGRTLLSQALTHGGPERIAEWFFEAGGDPETQDKFEDTPLSLSIRRQRQSLFKSLFESAFFANRKRLQGRILLRLAFQYSCYYAASVLLSYGVDPLLEDDRLCAEWRALLSSITIRESRI